jgi:hypothetical protein
MGIANDPAMLKSLEKYNSQWLKNVVKNAEALNESMVRTTLLLKMKIK